MTLPTLYKKTSTGAVQTWRIWTEDDMVVTEHGQLDGKKQVDRVLAVAKNVGRSNATTPETQAIADAQSKWEHKAKAGYVLTAAAALAGETHELIEGGVLPMLAESYAKRGDRIRFPAAVQPKLDGHRCLAIVGEDGVTLWSRTRKPIVSMPHINAAVLEMRFAPGVVLDGELYNHAYRDRFEELTSLIRPDYAKPGHGVVEYHVYDLAVCLNGKHLPFAERNQDLVAMLFPADGPLVLVETRTVADPDALMETFADFVADGYEGAIVRNLAGLYVNKRTDDLQKVKDMLDSEFPIKRVEEGKGRMAGRAVFVCTTPTGEEFNVKMAGSLDSLNQYFDDPTLAIGKLLTVKYQSLTAAGVPRFPVGLRLREDV